MISVECELFVPEVVQALAKSGELSQALQMMQGMMPMAERLGLDTEGLPDADEMTALAGFVEGMNSSLLVVGEDDESDWRVAGHLLEDGLRSSVEGPARIVGKVSKVIPRGRWRPYLTFPGMNLGSREERRRMERQQPEPGKENEFLAGPALMLDVLAIYR